MNHEQRKVLAVLNQMQKERIVFSQTEFLNRLKQYDRHRMIKLCTELHDWGYLDRLLIRDTREIIDIDLSYQGIIYKSTHRKALLLACSRWVLDHLLELVALVLSLIALVRTLS